MNPDVELIARSIARDERAFGDLFDRHSTAVYRFAYSLTHDPTEAQELVQETFVTAWRRLADIRLAGDSMLPWLIVTTRNHALNLRRTIGRRHEVMPIEEHIALRGAIAEHTEQQRYRDELEWVYEAIRELSPTDQKIVELCLFDGLSYAEAALQMGLSVHNVTKRVQRSRAQLRRLRDESRFDDRGEVSS